MEKLTEARRIFYALCEKYELQYPAIMKAKEDDTCDYTSVNEVRFNFDSSDMPIDEHVYHVWAHWICDLHQEPDPTCHQVVDLITSWIEKEL